MEINNKKAEQDFLTNKILLVFTMVFVGIFATMYLGKMSNSTGDSFLVANTIINGISVISIVGLWASILKFYSEIKKKIDTSMKYFSGKNLTSVFTVMTISSAIIYKFSIFTATKYIYVLLTAVAVLYFILVTYSKDVYIIALTNIVNLFLIYVTGLALGGPLFFIIPSVSIVFLAVVYIFVNKTKANDGKVKDITVFKKNTNYKLLNLNIVILAIITVLSAVLAHLGLTIGLIIGGIYLIVIVFHNTIKML